MVWQSMASSFVRSVRNDLQDMGDVGKTIWDPVAKTLTRFKWSWFDSTVDENCIAHPPFGVITRIDWPDKRVITLVINGVAYTAYDGAIDFYNAECPPQFRSHFHMSNTRYLDVIDEQHHPPISDETRAAIESLRAVAMYNLGEVCLRSILSDPFEVRYHMLDGSHHKAMIHPKLSVLKDMRHPTHYIVLAFAKDGHVRLMLNGMTLCEFDVKPYQPNVIMLQDPDNLAKGVANNTADVMGVPTLNLSRVGSMAVWHSHGDHVPACHSCAIETEYILPSGIVAKYI